jgi:hypothetical protein
MTNHEFRIVNSEARTPNRNRQFVNLRSPVTPVEEDVCVLGRLLERNGCFLKLREGFTCPSSEHAVYPSMDFGHVRIDHSRPQTTDHCNQHEEFEHPITTGSRSFESRNDKFIDGFKNIPTTSSQVDRTP